MVVESCEWSKNMPGHWSYVAQCVYHGQQHGPVQLELMDQDQSENIQQTECYRMDERLRCESDKQLQHKPVAPFQPARVWVGWVEPSGLKTAGSFSSARNTVARTGTFGEGTAGSCTEGGGASGADVKSKFNLRRRSYEQGSSVEQA